MGLMTMMAVVPMMTLRAAARVGDSTGRTSIGSRYTGEGGGQVKGGSMWPDWWIMYVALCVCVGRVESVVVSCGFPF